MIWAPPSEIVSSSIPSWQTLTAHAQPFRMARDLAFCLKVPLDSPLVWASSEGSGETARMRRLAWTFAARIGDKYQIRLTRSIYRMANEPRHDKTNKMSVRPAKTQISLDIRPVWSVSSLSAWKEPWVLRYLLSAQRRLWSDRADAQADLSLRWAHSHFVGFVMSRLKWFLFYLTHICLASHFCDLGKQWRPRSDAAFWSGSTLSAYRHFYSK